MPLARDIRRGPHIPFPSNNNLQAQYLPVFLLLLLEFLLTTKKKTTNNYPLEMFRNAVARPLLRANQRLVATRSFSIATVKMGEGDLGAPKAGGSASR